MNHAYLERALFIVGPQNSGKSVQLRSMFADIRLGMEGEIPQSRNIPDTYSLSNERRLYVRLTSPHETEEDLEAFLSKAEGKMDFGRWCFAGALQVEAEGNMPDLIATIQAFTQRFTPERIRVCFLSPYWHGEVMDLSYFDTYIPGLLNIEGVEYSFIDARNREANGLCFADFFDFT